jgi:hypothetical protein
MRLAGIEPNPRHDQGAELFTYECGCGEVIVQSTVVL